MEGLAHSYLFWIGLILLLVVLYLLPTLIGLLRGVENFALLIAFNFLGGLTCIGWPAALFLAFVLPTRRDRW
ncbi:superinfection immunity protein [Planotetraspora sp. A-T 1434]|uniref:superinfection immunity protein n=1 Tax=Planotetraspora sp. A-T 1434 TaxID=2979219 RepID=UPI0021C0A882|nr:superinfection immunity protein [Planotetraspora sp. A-T 1434]MCT9934950.1 superinfection immunity protein [Planotetraspora sp. A-T 1434]